MTPESFKRAKKIEEEKENLQRQYGNWADNIHENTIRITNDMNKTSAVSGILYVPDIDAIRVIAENQISDKIKELEEEFKAL